MADNNPASPAQQLEVLKQQMQKTQFDMEQAQAKLSQANTPGTPLGAVQPPIEAPKPLTPKEQMKVLMSSESWSILQGLLHWGKMWEAMHAGKPIEANDDNKMVMMAPWTFFGASPATLGNLFQYITPAFMNAYGQYESDEVFRRANPMPWIIVQTVAPMFALIDRGRDAQLQTWEVIKQLRATDDLPLEMKMVA